MNRKIKFEYGFQGVNGIIKKVYHLSEIPNIKNLCDVWNEIPVLYSRQFTGLTDMNGKEVYEKDIITIMLKNSPFKIKCTVIYKQSQCQFMAMEMTKNKLVYQLHRNRNIEVIGNPFENPELLK